MSHMGAQRHVKHLHVNLPHIASHPLLEYVDVKPAKLLRSYRAVRHLVARLHVKGTVLTRPCPPANVCQRNHVCTGALHDRDELNVPRSHSIPEELVDLERMLHIAGM